MESRCVITTDRYFSLSANEIDNSTLMFGKNGLISTSNEFTSDTVSIQTNVPVLFIVDLNHNRNADALVSSS